MGINVWVASTRLLPLIQNYKPDESCTSLKSSILKSSIIRFRKISSLKEERKLIATTYFDSPKIFVVRHN